MIPPVPSSAVQAATKKVSSTRQALRHMGKASRHYGNIAFQHERQIKYLTAIVASFLLVLQRVFTAWKTTWTAQTSESRKFSKKEAYRTTLREFGGFTFSYALLKMIEKKYTQKLQASIGLRGKDAPPSKSNPLPSMGHALKGWATDMAGIVRGKPNTAAWKPKKLYRANTLPALSSGNFNLFKLRYNESKSFRRWVNLFQPETWGMQGVAKKSLSHNHLKAGRKAIEVFKPFLKNAPMVVGGVTALALSGFFLEWLTINKMDTLTQWLSGSDKEATSKDDMSGPDGFSPAVAALPLRNGGNGGTVTIPKQPQVLTSWDVYDTFSQPFTSR